MAYARNEVRVSREQISSHTELRVYQRAFELAMRIFELTRTLPREERYALTDQIRRSSRSVCANIAEAWPKRRYRNAFISKLSDAQSELAETQSWLQFAAGCNYLERALCVELQQEYAGLAKALSKMIIHADDWLLPPP